MVDCSDVGFVDPHAKGDGGTDDGEFSGHELVLNFGADFGSESSVVGAGVDVVLLEVGG